MSEDNNANVAAGQVVVTRGMGDEHLNWMFNSPDWAKPVQLTTGVSVLSHAGTEALKKSPAGVP